MTKDPTYWKNQENELEKLLQSAEYKVKNIYCIGDCLTAGVGANCPYSFYLQELLGNKYAVINLGRTMLRMELLIKFQNLFLPERNYNNDIALIWIGTNDIYDGNDIIKTLNEIDNYYELLKSKGMKIIFITLLPRSNQAPIDFEDKRKIFNNHIESEYDIIDLAGNEFIGYPGAEKNKQYYNEENNTHLNDAGYRLIAEIIAKYINNL